METRNPGVTLRGSSAAALALALVLTGCADAVDDDSGREPASASRSSDDGSASPDDSGEDTDLATAKFALSWEDAVQKAKQGFDGKLISVGLDDENSRFAYTVTLVSDTEEYEADVSADSGKVLNEETKTMDNDDSAETANEIIDIDKVVPWQDARDTAIGAVEGRIDEWKLEGTKQGPHYQFDIAPSAGRDVEVTVDAYTGKIVTQGH